MTGLNAFTHRAELPLAGVTVGVKANIAVGGMPFHAGIGAWADRIAERDAEIVAGLRRAGAVIVGVLNMEEAALGAKGDNPHFGAVQNPHSAGYSPGGSSGGSGAAVADGVVRPCARHRHDGLDPHSGRALRRLRLQARDRPRQPGRARTRRPDARRDRPARARPRFAREGGARDLAGRRWRAPGRRRRACRSRRRAAPGGRGGMASGARSCGGRPLRDDARASHVAHPFRRLHPGLALPREAPRRRARFEQARQAADLRPQPLRRRSRPRTGASSQGRAKPSARSSPSMAFSCFRPYRILLSRSPSPSPPRRPISHVSPTSPACPRCRCRPGWTDDGLPVGVQIVTGEGR